MKESSVDRILEVLDNAGQVSYEPSYGDYDRSRCWRCGAPPGEGASGVCDRCREVLLAELPPAEQVELEGRLINDVARDLANRDRSDPARPCTCGAEPLPPFVSTITVGGVVHSEIRPCREARTPSPWVDVDAIRERYESELISADAFRAALDVATWGRAYLVVQPGAESPATGEGRGAEPTVTVVDEVQRQINDLYVAADAAEQGAWSVRWMAGMSDEQPSEVEQVEQLRFYADWIRRTSPPFTDMIRHLVAEQEAENRLRAVCAPDDVDEALDRVRQLTSRVLRGRDRRLTWTEGCDAVTAAIAMGMPASSAEVIAVYGAQVAQAMTAVADAAADVIDRFGSLLETAERPARRERMCPQHGQPASRCRACWRRQR